jgi:hypothetical protein
MTNRRSVSRSQWVTCLASVFLVSLLAYVARGDVALGFSGQAELAYSRNAKIQLAPYTLEAIRALREDLSRLETEGFPTPPPPPVGWSRQWRNSVSDAASRVDYQLDRSGLAWVQLVEFIDQLETHFRIESLDIRSRGSLTHREIAQVNITIAVPIETTRRQAATTFLGSGFAALRRQDIANPLYAVRSSAPDHSASRLRRPVRTAFRFAPSIRRFAGGVSFIKKLNSTIQHPAT